MARRKSKRRVQAQKEGYRSAFEKDVADQAKEDGIEFDYEPEGSELVWIPKPKKYLPDFVLKNGVIVETKGRLTQADRVKLLSVKDQHPDKDVRLVFQFDNKLTRSSSTRYSEWCERNGIKYALKRIPKEWAQEKSK